MQFKFKAKTKEGEIKRGKIDAVDEAMATQLLQKNELVPINLKEIKQSESISSDREINYFCKSKRSLVVLS